MSPRGDPARTLNYLACPSGGGKERNIGTGRMKYCMETDHKRHHKGGSKYFLCVNSCNYGDSMKMLRSFLAS